jgi:SAM-dependent methyltransferase
MRPDNYFDHERPEIAACFEPEGARILDLGCAAGALGALLKRRGARTVIGLEIATEPAARARARLDDVVVADLDRLPALPFEPGSFDVVICADVLEHLADPWRVLAMVRDVLVPGGLVIASIPNVRHESVVLPLLVAGAFEYQAQGILDRTHLRFFTFDGIRALLEGAGFVLELPVLSSRSAASPALGATSGLVATLGGDPVRYRDEATIVQYIVRARLPMA